MAKFLTTVGNSYHIEQIIIEAKENLVLVTPYLKLSRNLIERITDADRKGIKITVIYGKSDLAKQEHDVLYALNNIRIYFCDHLHAKCYHNEETMIITSMNLYEFSERNNREMGIALEICVDGEIFNKAKEEIDSIINISRLDKPFSNTSSLKDAAPILKTNETIKEETKAINDRTHEYLYIQELGKRLKEKYSNAAITVDTGIRIENFPKMGITVSVNGRIDFEFKNELQYNEVKRHQSLFKVEEYPRIRFYWNHLRICIYHEPKFIPEKSDKGAQIIVNKFLKIIEVISSKLMD